MSIRFRQSSLARNEFLRRKSFRLQILAICVSQDTETQPVEMMTKKRLALIAVLPLTIALILSVLAMLPPRINLQAFDRLQPGMTSADVEDILGPRNADVSKFRELDRKGWTYHKQCFDKKALDNKKPLDLPDQAWVSNAAKIGVWYDADGKLLVTIIWTANPDFTWHARLRRWLHL